MRFLGSINLSKNPLVNAVLEQLAVDPGTPAQGQVWYNTTDNLIKYADNGGIKTLQNAESILATTLDQFTKPAADMDFNGHKLINLADGTASADAINKGQLDAAIVAIQGQFSNALQYKGAFDASVGTFDALADGIQGDLYKVTAAGTVDGIDCQVGDTLIVNKDVTGTPVAADIDKIDNTESPDIIRTGMLDEDTITNDGGTIKVTANAFRNNNKFAATIFDGASKTATVTHGLDTTDVVVDIYDAATNEKVIMDVTVVDANNISVIYAAADTPTANSFKAVVAG